MNNVLQQIVGKKIKRVFEPDEMFIGDKGYCDHNIIIEFTDGTKIKLASWDYEGYSSGIDIGFVETIKSWDKKYKKLYDKN